VNRLDEAVESYQQALTLEPQNETLKNKLKEAQSKLQGKN
jgi:hypothetical protein